ncbi:MAG TPA: hypothetical protein VKA38_08305, partial [Draconibacterium sp.]|nr:hypothetical protein [Draconibacterium sp.]
SLNYVKVFYNAMIIFARKHFSSGRAGLFSLLIHLAIYFRAFISIMKRATAKIYLPLLDAVLIYSGYLFLTPYWENVRFDEGYYPAEFLQVVVPAYILFWLFGILFSGGYKKPVDLLKLARGLLWGSVAILLVYSMVGERFRFSRALILLGSVWAFFSLVLFRLILHWLKVKGYRLNIKKTKRIAIVGHSDEANRVKQLLDNSQVQSELAGFIAIDKSDTGHFYIGNLAQLNEIIRINRIDEIVFCAENISSAEIIRAMLDLTQLDIEYKIAPPESISIIGSNSIHTAGDLYVVNVNAISKRSNLRKKRIFDVAFAMIYLLLCPFIVWFFKKRSNFIQNAFNVFTGKRTWIGYVPEPKTYKDLPNLKPAILHPGDLFTEIRLDDERKRQLNMLYAKDYSISTDAEILLKGWKSLDR